ncbi:HAD family hydrolase [Haladaptatus sp. YSMS36]|uniref:HAD family hydrolase n=1 Tax=Haladaptatus sp. YSMS36 TaxID=3033384 RepID=UPI0023E82CED|nr:HAD family hydrolase [Haladaptatus sp. YSMS36]
MTISFDLFGTLVSVTYPNDPAAAVAAELEARNVTVPDDWEDAYHEVHVDAPPGAEVPLPAHVNAALRSRGVDFRAGGDGNGNVVRRALVAAFDPEVTTRPGAVEAVAAAREYGPVGVLSNCSVPGLARRALVRSDLDSQRFDAIVTSLGCGWRKPDARAFESVARMLDAPVTELVHVGDDPETDGGAADAGGTAVLLDDVPLTEFPDWLVER